jgi:hypothetical protein
VRANLLCCMLAALQQKGARMVMDMPNSPTTFKTHQAIKPAHTAPHRTLKVADSIASMWCSTSSCMVIQSA